MVDHIVEHLARTGVEYIFGVDGANIEDLYDAAYFQPDITAVLAKHEFSAATMADGYSRSGVGLGVVAATSGGGALNLVPGLGESFASRIPVLALVGQPATTMDGQGSFQDTSGRNGSLNAEALFSQISVYCKRVRNAADIVSALPAAIAAAHTGGPAVLLLPKDIQQSVINRGCSLDVGRHRSVGDPHPIVRALRRVDRTGHDHRRRAGCPRRRTRRTGGAARGAPRTSGLRAGREGRRGYARLRVVVGAGSDRCDGPPGCGPGRAGQRAVPGGGHPAFGDRAGRSRRGAGRGADDVHRVSAAVPRLHPRPHRRSTGVASDVDRRLRRRGPARRASGARPDNPHRTHPAALRGSRSPLPRRDERTGRRAAGRGGHRRRRRKHRRGSHSLPPGAPSRPVRGRTGHGWHGLQLWSRHRNGVRPQKARARRSSGGDRRGRRVLHARHGGAHGSALPASGDVCVAQQQRTRDVCDPRAALLQRLLQLQPVLAQSSRCRLGRDVPQAGVNRRQRHRGIGCGSACLA